MYTIALLTCQDFPDLTVSDQQLIPELFKLGIVADVAIWDDPDINWKKYDALVFRNTWDYFIKEDLFFKWIKMLIHNDIKTFNPLKVIVKNAHKFYLKEMEASGIKIIPSIFISKKSDRTYKDIIPFDWDKAVIKPAISAGSYLTELFDISIIDDVQKRYMDIGRDRDLIIQKFVPQIQIEGEISMVYFNKKFSHSVLKTPKKGDFRIQSQFGGKYMSFNPSEDVLGSAQCIINCIQEELLYARVDGVLVDSVFHLMELELIEPDLYVDYMPGALKSFSETIKLFLEKAMIN
ncbi:MAG: hypothetical protein IPL55_15240 [Saprospiraceae bacterium]|jgi:hypothetical protein|nr:hypothetical protein [Saprospiraceae bacterium]